jgi:peptidoglycan hydrolase-like protein with peptidoglycan-binding domain
VNFSINVGTPVPSHVRVVAVPQTLVEIYPEWRGDEYFVTQNEIIIVDHSRKIVAIVPAHSRQASAPSEEISVSELSPSEIREIQTVLIQRGYYHGRADGVFGAETRQALITFQRKQGIQSMGEIDSRTVSSLGLSGKINVGARGTSATTGQAPSGNAPQGQLNNKVQHEQNNTRPQAEQRGGQNQQPSAQENAPQSQSKAPNARQSTTGQGGQSQDRNARQSTGQGKSMQDAPPRKYRGGSSTSGQGNEPEAKKANTNNKKNEQ